MIRLRWKPLLFFLLLAVFWTGTFLWRNRPFSVTTFSAVRMGGVTVVIDAGHGGEDGGAVSPNGTVESGINLAIAQRLDDLLHFYGVSTVMVRRENRSLHDDAAKTLREKKRADLAYRTALVNETENGVLISIHQNINSSQRLSGAQVFYANEESSLPWAQNTQALLCQTLDPENRRQAARISDSVYLMKHITRPAILVECGFLSNPQEEQKLQTEQYQIQLAAVLAAAAFQTYEK